MSKENSVNIPRKISVFFPSIGVFSTSLEPDSLLWGTHFYLTVISSSFFFGLHPILGALPLVCSTILYLFFLYCVSQLGSISLFERAYSRKLNLENSIRVELSQSLLALIQGNSRASFHFWRFLFRNNQFNHVLKIRNVYPK